jgi:hypothetical protein
MTSWNNSGAFVQELYSVVAKSVYTESLRGSGEEERLPAALQDWLGRLRLLYGVPFEYLVPDERLLPTESIRFFYLDRNWTDRLVEGALSVGKTSSREYAHHHAVNSLVVTALDRHERQVRLNLRKSEEASGDGPAGDITGMLLRSRVVSGWPGLEVKAYEGPEVGAYEEVPSSPHKRLRLLRMDRLSPNILLCLFDGIPTIVDIEEPREGIQFGVNPTVSESGVIGPVPGTPSGFNVNLRHLHGSNAGELVMENGKHKTLPVPVRKANHRVLHITELREQLESALGGLGVNMNDADGGEAPDTLHAAEMAVELLQFPYRQRFQGNGIAEPNSDQPMLDLGNIYSGASIAVHAELGDLTEIEQSELINWQRKTD